MAVASPTKPVAKAATMLPMAAVAQPMLTLEGNGAGLPTPTPSPMSRPMCTPSNAATTAWRTTVCPHPPTKHGFYRGSSTSWDAGDETPGSTPMGLLPPSTLWPTPTSTPMGSPKACSTPLGFGFPATLGTPSGATASAGFGAFLGEQPSSPSKSPQLQVATPSPVVLCRTRSDPSALQRGTRLQTISDSSPTLKDDSFSVFADSGYPMDRSMEAASSEEFATPSPDKLRRDQRMATSASPPRGVRLARGGPMVQDSKPLIVQAAPAPANPFGMPLR